jgi:hypothetical protein
MDRKIAEAERAKPPLESILKLALKLISGERLLAAKDAANLPRLSTSWLARVPGQRLVRYGKASAGAKHFSQSTGSGSAHEY